ncbi:MAG: tetratricopeptide repeat protein [Pseudomonadota bacterium]
MRCVGGVFTGLTLALLASPAAAQDSGATAREVVQPLPTAEVQRLNRALRQLARRPRDLGVLVEAGNAAMVLGDYDAAIGFFGRAQDISPNEPRVKMGMAAVFLRSDRPIEALRLFSEAEAAGASSRDVLPDRGLAFDLVGNNARAQETYRRALVLKDDNEVTRRLALSQAITGDSDGFEETLRPLLEERDFAAFRTQAFGLAILGRQDEAAAIADAVMPRDLAARMTPFLAFMPRLTKAQQAAAANLGIFPAAADVGRDDPRIAQYAAQGNAIARAADDRLAPSGEPLGQPSGERGSSGGDEDAKPTEPKASVADAFAEFGDGAPPAAPGGEGAVDLAAIEIPREDETQPEPEVQKPAHPSRQWVQVATGRDRSALRFDWRRFARTAPDQLGDLSPHVVRWGESNRLLAGPLPNAGEARAMVNALREKGLDSFTYTSPEGQEIQELK